MDGLVWGSEFKVVDVAYGIQKLIVPLVIEDEKIGLEDLEEKILNLEGEQVQSVDLLNMVRARARACAAGARCYALHALSVCLTATRAAAAPAAASPLCRTRCPAAKARAGAPHGKCGCVPRLPTRFSQCTCRRLSAMNDSESDSESHAGLDDDATSRQDALGMGTPTPSQDSESRG